MELLHYENFLTSKRWCLCLLVADVLVRRESRLIFQPYLHLIVAFSHFTLLKESICMILPVACGEGKNHYRQLIFAGCEVTLKGIGLTWTQLTFLLSCIWNDALFDRCAVWFIQTSRKRCHQNSSHHLLVQPHCRLPEPENVACSWFYESKLHFDWLAVHSWLPWRQRHLRSWPFTSCESLVSGNFRIPVMCRLFNIVTILLFSNDTVDYRCLIL